MWLEKATASQWVRNWGRQWGELQWRRLKVRHRTKGGGCRGTDTNLTKQGRHGAFSSEASTGLTLWGSQQRARAAAVSWSRNRAPMFSKSLTNSKSRNLTYKWHNLNVISLLILEMTKFNLFPLYVISSVWKLHGVFEANKPAPFLPIHNKRDKCSKNSWLCNTASSYRIKTNRKMVKLCIKEFAQKYILD